MENTIGDETFQELEIIHDNKKGTILKHLVDKQTGQEIVKKEIHFSGNSLHSLIFKKEITALDLLRSSSNVVKIIGSRIDEFEGTDKKIGVIFLEYIIGNPLAKAYSAITDISDLFSIVKDIMEGLKCAHINGVIHRDLNPNNIMITPDPKAKIIDFGIAKIKEMIQEETTYQYRTNGYTAPEINSHENQATERSDIYSLGATIYFLFTHRTPPLPNEIYKSIQDSSSIDPEFKEVLLKMTAYDPQDRYESILDLEEAVYPIFNRYLMNGEKYTILVSGSITENLKQKGLVRQNRFHTQILENEIANNFARTYLRYNTATEESPETFIFDGLKYSFVCIAKDNFPIEITPFQVVKIYQQKIQQREANKNYGLLINGKLNFLPAHVTPRNDHDNYQLINRIKDYYDYLNSNKHIDHQFKIEYYGIWNDYLQTVIGEEEKKRVLLHYKSFSQTPTEYIFNLQNSFPSEFQTIDTAISYYLPNRRRHLFLGHYLNYDPKKRILTVYKKKASIKITIPQNGGDIILSQNQKIDQYQHQSAALNKFRYGETENEQDLKPFFLGTGCFSSKDPSFASIGFFNKLLNPSQKLAVEKNLTIKELSLIQGPPGTGKTDVIVEVVRQIIHHNEKFSFSPKKILIVSQANTAVDKILADIHPYLVENRVNAVRISNDKNSMSELANTLYSTESQKQQWVNNILERSNKQFHSDLNYKNIDLEDFIIFYEACERQKISNQINSSTDQEILSSFLTTYQFDEKDHFLEQLLIQYDWINNLSTSQEIEEYYIQNATIILGTCSGFSSNPYVSKISFNYVIVDEAAKASLPELLQPIIPGRKIILIGDHKQLPPILEEQTIRDIRETEKKVDIAQLKNCGFGKIFNQVPNECKITLSTQYRMHPVIGDMINRVFYEDISIQNGVSFDDRSHDLRSFLNYPMVWLSTSSFSREERSQNVSIDEGHNSFTNSLESSIVIDTLNKIIAEDPQRKYSIGVISPYRSQVKLINSKLTLANLPTNIQVSTVDAFQGSQMDIIIYSTVLSNKNHQLRFLKEENRLNVAFSRAKRLLIIVGDVDFFMNADRQNNYFIPIIRYMCKNEHCLIQDLRRI